MGKLHIKKGDIVFVSAGEDKGKTGKVLEVFPEKQRAIVEGRNMVSKHTKPNAESPQGGIIKKEAPIHISNLNVKVNVKDSSTGKSKVAGSRISRKMNDDGKRVRIAKKTGEEIK